MTKISKATEALGLSTDFTRQDAAEPPRESHPAPKIPRAIRTDESDSVGDAPRKSSIEGGDPAHDSSKGRHAPFVDGATASTLLRQPFEGAQTLPLPLGRNVSRADLEKELTAPSRRSASGEGAPTSTVPLKPRTPRDGDIMKLFPLGPHPVYAVDAPRPGIERVSHSGNEKDKVVWAPAQRHAGAEEKFSVHGARSCPDNSLPPTESARRADYEDAQDSQFTLPFPGVASYEKRRNVVLSIKPFYSENILSGRKTVELRRKFPVRNTSGITACINSTSPTKAMVGAATIRKVLKLPIEDIWDEFKSSALIEREDFDNYFVGLDEGFVLMLDEVNTLPRPFYLSELREKFGFEPPQSFLYAKQDLLEALMDG